MEKMSSKRDVYNFLTEECEAYLPKLDTVNIYFLKQITRGDKEVSYAPPDPIVHKATGVTAVPQIEGLTIEDFTKYARSDPVLLKFLPDERDWHHLDKKWMCDVLYT